MLSSRALRSAPAAGAPARRAVVTRFANDPSGSTGTKAKIQFTLPHHVEFGQEVALVGDADILGKWDATAAVSMNWTDGDVWTATAEVPLGSSLQYKYIIRAPDSGEVIEWQAGDNLTIELPPAADGPVVVKDAWEGDGRELIVGAAAAAPAPAVEAPAPEPVKPVAAAEPATPKAEPVAAVAEAEPAPTRPSGGKTPIVAAAAAEEEPAPPAPTPKPAAGPKPRTTGTKGPKGGRRSSGSA